MLNGLVGLRGAQRIILRKSYPRRTFFVHHYSDAFLDRFFLHFGSILGPKLATFSSKMGGAGWHAAPFFVGSMLFFDFLVVLAPSWPNLGSILEGFGPPFWKFLGSILEVSGHDLGAMWLVILVLF